MYYDSIYRVNLIIHTLYQFDLLIVGAKILQRAKNVETSNRRGGYSNHLSCSKWQLSNELNSFIWKLAIILCWYFLGAIPFSQGEYVRWNWWLQASFIRFKCGLCRLNLVDPSLLADYRLIIEYIIIYLHKNVCTNSLNNLKQTFCFEAKIIYLLLLSN